MPLLKRITKPAQFTPEELANRLLRQLGWKDAPEPIRRTFIDAEVGVLNEMVAEGILSTK
jgi:hypothetical protein